MKIIEIKSNEILYDSEGEEKYYVTSEFWEVLKAKKIQYSSGGMKNGNRYSEILLLNIKEKDFELIFKRIANSTIGKEVMEGRMPINTRL